MHLIMCVVAAAILPVIPTKAQDGGIPPKVTLMTRPRHGFSVANLPFLRTIRKNTIPSQYTLVSEI